MHIGLDLDEVVAEFFDEVIKFYHKKTGELHKKENMKSYNFWELWDISREEAVNLIEDFHENHNVDTITPVEKAIESVNHLLTKNKITIITARPSKFKHKVESWLNKHFPEANLEVIYASGFHGNQYKTKPQICKDINVDLIIEDSLQTAKECATKGIKVILFDKPWNQSQEQENITRVFHWPQAVKEIERIDPVELEYAYVKHPIVFNAINKATQAIMTAGWDLKSKDQKTREYFENFINQIGKVGANLP